jgi:Zn-dependent protease with chaperone function
MGNWSRRRCGDTALPGGVVSFQDEQSRARRLTAALLVAFALCFPAMLALEAGILAGLHHLAVRANVPVLAPLIGGLRRLVPTHCAVSVAIVVVMAERRWLQCAGSGTSVAWLLGARWVASPTDRLEERRLLNVTEEMAIAAGVRAPAVFVLDGEPGINAFAAGTRREFAAIIVTRGALDYLTRDELQGLVAHEMSHVVRGDVAINHRMIGLVSGLRALYTVARRVTRVSSRAWYAPIDSPREKDAILVLFPGPSRWSASACCSTCSSCGRCSSSGPWATSRRGAFRRP